MDPISITFLVLGVVIIAAEACKYIKNKFFHHKEKSNGETMVIKADEFHMDGNNLIKLVRDSQDYSSGDRDDDGEAHNIHATNLKITYKVHSSSMERITHSQAERGGSKVAEDVAHVVGGIASPWSGVTNIVSNILEEGVSRLPNPFAKAAPKTKLDAATSTNPDIKIVRSHSDSQLMQKDITEVHGAMTCGDNGERSFSAGSSPALARKLGGVFPTMAQFCEEEFGSKSPENSGDSEDEGTIVGGATGMYGGGNIQYSEV